MPLEWARLMAARAGRSDTSMKSENGILEEIGRPGPPQHLRCRWDELPISKSMDLAETICAIDLQGSLHPQICPLKSDVYTAAPLFQHNKHAYKPAT